MNHVVRNAQVRWMTSVYFTKAEKTAPWKQQYFRRNTTEVSAGAPMPCLPFCTMAAALQPLQRMLFLRIAKAAAQLPIHTHTVGDCWTHPQMLSTYTLLCSPWGTQTSQASLCRLLTSHSCSRQACAWCPVGRQQQCQRQCHGLTWLWKQPGEGGWKRGCCTTGGGSSTAGETKQGLKCRRFQVFLRSAGYYEHHVCCLFSVTC